MPNNTLMEHVIWPLVKQLNQTNLKQGWVRLEYQPPRLVPACGGHWSKSPERYAFALVFQNNFIWEVFQKRQYFHKDFIWKKPNLLSIWSTSLLTLSSICLHLSGFDVCMWTMVPSSKYACGKLSQYFALTIFALLSCVSKRWYTMHKSKISNGFKLHS